MSSSFKKGFTFIEIIVVTTIIILIFGFATVKFSQLSVQSRDTRRLQDVEKVREALQLFKQYYVSAGIGYNRNVYPGFCTVNGSTDPANCSGDSFPLNHANITSWLVTLGMYLKAMPADPKTPATACKYFYSVSSDLQSYTIFMQLEDTNSDKAISSKPIPKSLTRGSCNGSYTSCNITNGACNGNTYNYWVNSP